MGDTPDVPSPGGWLQLYGVRVYRAIVVGTLGTTAALTILGTFNGAQAGQTCEARLTSATKNTVTYSCLNPLPNGITGAILPSNGNYVMLNENTAPLTLLNIGTSSTSTGVVVGTAGAANVASGVVLNGAKRILTLAQTGALTAYSAHGPTPITLAPRDDTHGKRFLNFTFQRGSGATVSGEAPAYAHIEITPCNLAGVGC